MITKVNYRRVNGELLRTATENVSIKHRIGDRLTIIDNNDNWLATVVVNVIDGNNEITYIME